MMPNIVSILSMIWENVIEYIFKYIATTGRMNNVRVWFRGGYYCSTIAAECLDRELSSVSSIDNPFACHLLCRAIPVVYAVTGETPFAWTIIFPK